MSERLDVKAAATADNDTSPALLNFLDGGEGEAPEFLDVHFLAQRDDGEKVVRRFFEQGDGRFGREQIKAAIDLKRVGVNDLRVDRSGDIRRNLRLSSG